METESKKYSRFKAYNHRDMNVLKAILIFLISFDSGHTQIVSKENVKDYLSTLSTLMWQTLKDYGISNLPDVDTKVTYNISKAYGYNLVGNLYFEDGFVMDISKISIFSKENTAMTNYNISRISCTLRFEGLRILRDFRYESDNGHIADRSFGSIVITPQSYEPSIVITKYLENNTVDAQFVSGTPNYQPGKKLLQFYPLNGLTMRLKKGNVRPPVLAGLWELWEPIFSSFLIDIAGKVEFPPILYEF